MPLSESSYLPPAAFVLSHVLGIAGVLYWRSRSREGRDGPRGGGRGTKMAGVPPARVTAYFPFPRAVVAARGGTDVAGGEKGRRSGGGDPPDGPGPHGGVEGQRFGCLNLVSPPIPGRRCVGGGVCVERVGFGVSHWGRGCFLSWHKPATRGRCSASRLLPRHGWASLPPLAVTAASGLATDTGKTWPRELLLALALAR